MEERSLTFLSPSEPPGPARTLRTRRLRGREYHEGPAAFHRHLYGGLGARLRAHRTSPPSRPHALPALPPARSVPRGESRDWLVTLPVTLERPASLPLLPPARPPLPPFTNRRQGRLPLGRFEAWERAGSERQRGAGGREAGAGSHTPQKPSPPRTRWRCWRRAKCEAEPQPFPRQCPPPAPARPGRSDTTARPGPGPIAGQRARPRRERAADAQPSSPGAGRPTMQSGGGRRPPVRPPAPWQRSFD
ncbi:basic proline-rich protein-like [Antechinus flavipes]|uniref:basic proline-rich protein-like n=1 Tax=Antechinus flavipes TaxID=38775 RepID=UPI0022357560|nr:basic proline-rich protein-like [Antechinus flavipes]